MCIRRLSVGICIRGLSVGMCIRRLSRARVSVGSPEALDAAALELLEALESLQRKRQELGHLLRQGWLSLSQARYSLGCHRVSSLQYGATMVPRVRVLPRQDAGGGLCFQEVPGTDPQEPDPQLGGGDGLRQRRAPPAKGGAPPRRPPDPLTWFGVLVPPSLRQAQGSFVQGVTVALEVAGLQEAVTAATARYRALLRRTRPPRGKTGDSQSLGDAESAETPGDGEELGDAARPGDTDTDTSSPGDAGTPCAAPAL
ncbi:coiled-coil domain-containing protein 115 isoform X2 [Larus michahellis]|uniref:coiled-coil domain-containing protein 115 isoform X2 n=1 Tax=Larus michahellis TaxID=119627 RepID=UPI003D9AB67D